MPPGPAKKNTKKKKKKAPASRPKANQGGPRRPAAQPTRQEKEAKALRNRLIAGAVLLVVAGAVVFAAVRPGGGPSVKDQLTSGPGGCTLDSRHDGDAANQGEHIPRPTFKVDPPAGGPHEPQAANPGFYEGAKAPPDGQLVHAMEHGFVVLWYRPDLAPEKLDQLEQLSDQFGRELIVAPRPSLDGEVAVTAWHRRLLCRELAPDKIAVFTREFKDRGPEKGFL